jgi:membrane-bound lytic murein transglycosylase F
MTGPTSTPDDPPTRSSRRLPWRPVLALLTALLAAGLLGTCSVRPGVLEQVRILGVLKIATRNSPTAYYLGAQGPEGPEFELASRFARELGVPASFVTLASPGAVLEEVATGRAHIGAAGLSITAAWQRQVAFSRPYQRVRLHLIHRRDKPRPDRLEALGSRTLEVVAGSAHAAALAELAATVPGLRYTTVESGDTLDLLDKVWSGEIDTTIADRNEFSLTRNFHPELRIAFNLPNASELAWALPRGDRTLAARVDAYLASVEADMPALVQRYYAPDDRFDYAGARQLVRDAEDRLPALRPHFEAVAREFGEDWRVLAAIGYQESRWNPLAVSPTGVRGVMMLTAETAEALGIEDRADPGQSIRGGASYLHQMRDLIPARVPEPDRTWLALAAYNVGYGHLEDARVLAQSHHKDPDSWQDVREFLPMLAQERFYVQLKRGYARGWEAARFVDNVRSYLDVLEWISPEPSPPSR